MKVSDDEYVDPLLTVSRTHIPSAFADMVTSMDAVMLKRKREADLKRETGGVSYFDAVMSNFFAAPEATPC